MLTTFLCAVFCFAVLANAQFLPHNANDGLHSQVARKLHLLRQASMAGQQMARKDVPESPSRVRVLAQSSTSLSGRGIYNTGANMYDNPRIRVRSARTTVNGTTLKFESFNSSVMIIDSWMSLMMPQSYANLFLNASSAYKRSDNDYRYLVNCSDVNKIPSVIFETVNTAAGNAVDVELNGHDYIAYDEYLKSCVANVDSYPDPDTTDVYYDPNSEWPSIQLPRSFTINHCFAG
ncbi:hypothetical protein DdX_02578 [Ditylenchus destructor]|uniref:Peptidase A1 domain-containing protein n=1 Tax=Ditylenchus destructor TaxID=166010 RepID=A0AAD4NEI2_9BILA|nr:hypothetical protein DdX_02578 [Ditylenchus destructor]